MTSDVGGGFLFQIPAIQVARIGAIWPISKHFLNWQFPNYLYFYNELSSFVTYWLHTCLELTGLMSVYAPSDTASFDMSRTILRGEPEMMTSEVKIRLWRLDDWKILTSPYFPPSHTWKWENREFFSFLLESLKIINFAFFFIMNIVNASILNIERDGVGVVTNIVSIKSSGWSKRAKANAEVIWEKTRISVLLSLYHGSGVWTTSRDASLLFILKDFI